MEINNPQNEAKNLGTRNLDSQCECVSYSPPRETIISEWSINELKIKIEAA